MSTLVVRRPSTYRDRVRIYKVLVDGKEVGKIGNDSVMEFDISPGTVTVKGKIDWCSSPALEVAIEPGQKVTVTYQGTYQGAPYTAGGANMVMNSWLTSYE